MEEKEEEYKEAFKAIMVILYSNNEHLKEEITVIETGGLPEQAKLYSTVSMVDFWYGKMIEEMHATLHNYNMCYMLEIFKSQPKIQFRNEKGELNKISTCIICKNIEDSE